MKVVEAINRSGDLYTTSSCAGRIALMEVPDVEPKRGARFLGKWHGPVGPGDVLSLLAPPPRGPVWMFMQGVILHVTCRDLAAAKRVLDAAIASGHKASGVKGLGRRPVVEVRATEHMALPLARGGRMLAGEDYVRAVVDEANRRMERSRSRLERLERTVEDLA